MTPAEQHDVAIVAREQLRIADLTESLGRDLTPDESQDQIDRVNGLLDPQVGIVAGDGNYYPRRGFPE